MKNNLTLTFIASCMFISMMSYGQCGFIAINSQADVDNFPQNQPNCITVDNLRIEGPDIVNLNGLAQITTVNDRLTIRNCGNLTDISGLSNIISVGNEIFINQNNSLPNVDGLGNVTSDLIEIDITNNNSLQNLDGFSSISSVVDLVIFNNQSLTTIDGLNSISINNVDGGLQLSSNPMLSSIPDFNNISNLNVINIVENNSLEEITGFNGLIEFGGVGTIVSLLISDNTNLEVINGFNSCISIPNSIRIIGNQSLNEIIGFTNVGSGLDAIRIRENVSLTDISFLQNVSSNALQSINIAENPTLAICDYPSVCSYLAVSPDPSFALNDCGCSSNQEVLDYCNGLDPCSCGPIADILEEFYASTDGNQWTNNTGWLEDCDYCNWFGVTCDANQNVIGLNLQNNNLSGILPPSICQLGFLQNLILNENSIGGDIPSCLGQLSSLIRLVLNTNNFTGPIPDFTNTPSLITLQLAANELTGTLPSSLGNLSLLAFAVNDNNLTGCFDSNLSSLCTPQIFDINVTPGNNFDASWEDFCANGDGVCMTDCCGNAKVIGSTMEEAGGVFKEVDGIRLILSTTVLGSDTYAVISKLDNNNDVTWSRRITEASQFLDFTINDDGNILVIGRTTPVSVGVINQCIMGIINSNTGAVISMKKHEFFGRQTFSKILKHDNPKDSSFPYYIIGVENGTMNNTNANDDVIILNVGEQLQVNWSSKYIKADDNQWSRDIIGLSNGDILVVGDEDGVKGMLVTIDGSTGDAVSVMETTDNRSFSEIIEVAGGNFVSVGRSDAFNLNNGMLCYHNNDLSMIDAIHFDGMIKVFYSITETNPGTFIAAGTMLDDKTVLVEFTIPAGTIQIQNIKYLDHDGDASSRAYVSYVNGQVLYTESVQNHPMGFGAQDLYYASLNADLSDDCLVDTMFNTVSDAFVLTSQTLMKEPLVVDVGQNMSIGLFDYDLNDACQTVSSIDILDVLEIKIYPNPSSGIFTIESDDILSATISIYNITGQKITTITPTQEKVTLDLSDQRAGLYLIQVRSESGNVSTHKVIVAM